MKWTKLSLHWSFKVAVCNSLTRHWNEKHLDLILATKGLWCRKAHCKHKDFWWWGKNVAHKFIVRMFILYYWQGPTDAFKCPYVNAWEKKKDKKIIIQTICIKKMTFQSCYFSKGNHIIAVIKGSEDYSTLKDGLTNVCQAVNKIMVDGHMKLMDR